MKINYNSLNALTQKGVFFLAGPRAIDLTKCWKLLNQKKKKFLKKKKKKKLDSRQLAWTLLLRDMCIAYNRWPHHHQSTLAYLNWKKSDYERNPIEGQNTVSPYSR